MKFWGLMRLTGSVAIENVGGAAGPFAVRMFGIPNVRPVIDKL